MLHAQPAADIARLCRVLCLTCGLALGAGSAFAQSKPDATRGAGKAAACTACHGAPGAAPLPGTPTLAAQQPEFLVLQMFLMREGLRDVPQMRGLLSAFSDADLADVAAHFANQPLRKSEAGAQPRLYARGATVAKALGCGTCHLPNYEGQRQVPRLAGQREDFLALAMRAYRDDKRTGTDTSMNAAMYGVSDADIDALAHYLSRR